VGYGFIVLALIFGYLGAFTTGESAVFKFALFWQSMQPVLIIGVLARLLMSDFNFCGCRPKDQAS